MPDAPPDAFLAFRQGRAVLREPRRVLPGERQSPDERQSRGEALRERSQDEVVRRDRRDSCGSGASGDVRQEPWMADENPERQVPMGADAQRWDGCAPGFLGPQRAPYRSGAARSAA